MFKKIFAAAALSSMLLIPVALSAQALPQDNSQQIKTDYTDDEIATFAKAAKALEEIQKASEEKMIGIIEEKGLDVDTFNKIAMAQQNPNTEEKVSDDATMQKFEAASVELQQIQLETQPKMLEAVESSGLDVQAFQQMMAVYQQSPDMQARVQSLMEN